MTDWDRAKVKKVLDVLKEMKGFERLPLPQEIHKEFDIPLAKPRNLNVMDYFERYIDTQSLPVDKVEIIDGTKVHKDVSFPTSILEPFKMPEEYRPEGELVIKHDENEIVFSTDAFKRVDTPMPDLDIPALQDTNAEKTDS